MNLKKIIREELDDLDWIKGVSSSAIEPKTGDRVVVMNIGVKRYYIDWLGMYASSYADGIYGDNITGEVIRDQDRRLFMLKEENTGNEILFPHYSYMEDYYGLDLEYKILNIY